MFEPSRSSVSLKRHSKSGSKAAVGAGLRGHRSFATSLVCTSALLCTVVIGAANPATASTDTLRRSVSNITQAPLDLLLSPMTAIVGVVTRMREQDDPIPVRVVFGGPGIIWNLGVNIGSSAIRFATGGIEFVPGLFLLPLDTDLDTLFSPVENAGALFEMQTPCCLDVKFGIDYTAAAY